ncbi:phage tail protein [Undibacterium sp. JH2W]|uniref:phage tail protein n=1 Tax=Undibacterium sp. JH2W TaxID=3413037 RepID=UPI003BF39F63
MNVFVGTIMPVAFNFAPVGWAFCSGQLLSIAQNQALFSLLGTNYGGDGVNTFGLPDLRGRVAVGSQGFGPGLDPVIQGQFSGSNNATVNSSGTATVALTTANLPSHTHAASVDMAGMSALTTINVGTGVNGGLAAVANNGGLTSTSGGQSGAAIYLPASTQPTTPVTLGGVTTTVTGTGSVTNSNTGSDTPLTVPVESSATISNMQPYLGLNYIIATQGLFPSRN